MVEIEAEITADIFESFKEEALAGLGAEIEIDGFRKGKAPKEMIESKIPEIVLLEEMANLAIRKSYTGLLMKHEINPIGEPRVQLTKIAKGNPLGFIIATAIMPEVTLPDYKKIASSEEKDAIQEVTDGDVQKEIETIQKMRSPKKMNTEGEETITENEKETAEEPLPELTDEFVKTLGAFENVEDFKIKLKENMRIEREASAREKQRVRIIEKILEETKMEVPEFLISLELDKMLHRMKADIENMGLSFDDYMKHLGKSEEALRKEFETDAEKRVKVELILQEISFKEHIHAKEEEVQKEVEKILEFYKGADPDRTKAYVEMMLINEEVFKFLEGQK